MTKLDTQLVHGPDVNDNCTGAVTTPIYKATTFEYPKIGAPVTYDYSRSGNPTRQAVENQLATLEGASGPSPLPPGWPLSTPPWRSLRPATT